MMSSAITWAFATLLAAQPAQADGAADAAANLVDVTALSPAFILDIRYATSDNFFGKTVYPEARCLLRKPVAAKLLAAQKWLDKKRPGLRLMLKDCYRPHHIQFVLWDAVKGTPKSAYVADPNSKVGSIHSYGAAVDLTIAGKDGRELDMGTPYDFLGPLAEPRLQEQFVAQGKLTKEHVANRQLLRAAMVTGGKFVSIPNEWWHFDDDKKEAVRAKYDRLDVPFSAVPPAAAAKP